MRVRCGGYLSRFLKNIADVEDVVQETYARILNLSDSSSAAVGNWHAFLFASARNVALDRLRKARIVSLDTMLELDRVEVPDPTPALDEKLNARQELTLLSAVIASLPDRCREVLTLRKLHGLSQREIAQRLGITESTVEKHVAYGVRLCTERMFVTRKEPGKFDAAKAASNGRAKSDEQ